ncbi:MAG TPA: helix-turn-helix domain-containing protein [Acidimicrobiia bacterium]|nr:helix-turn-helix domain-containing protein [Acidimicrobiia bacterium]
MTRTVVVDSSPARPELGAWLDATCEFVRAVNRGVPLDDLLNLIAGTVAQLTTYDYCSVLLPDDASEKLLIRGFYGLRPSYVAEVNAARAPLIRPGELAEGPSSRAYRTQRPVVLPDIRADVTCGEWELVAAEQGYRSILALPLVASEGSLGVLTCYTRRPREFAPGEVVLMEAIANQAALAIESGRLRERERARAAALQERVDRLEEEQRVARRAEDVHRELMRRLLAGQSLEVITRALAEALRCDVLVEDAAGHPLAAARATGHLDRIPEPDGDCGLVTPVVLDEEVAGRVRAFNPARGFGAFERRALDRGAMVVALAVSKLRTAQEVEWRLSREFLDDLLAVDGRSDPGSTVTRAHQLGLELSSPYTLLVVRPDPGGEDSVAHLPGGAARLQRTLLTHVQRVVDATGVGDAALVAARGEDVILLWPERPGQPAAELGESLRRHIRAYVGAVSVGLGPPCHAVTEYGDAYRLAAGGLDLVQRAGQRDRVVTLSDLGVYRLLLQVKRPEELIDFMLGVLRPLYDYDGRRDTTLVETLRAFLGHGFSVTATAEALIVHPNTISYRLRRIEEILGVDCHDPQALLQFQLAFLVEDVLGAPPS